MTHADAPALLIDANDDVAVLLASVQAGQPLRGLGVAAKAETPIGHKIAVRELAAGQVVRKFGQAIGLASRPIAPGEHVHTHNLSGEGLEQRLAVATAVAAQPDLTGLPTEFLGYPRDNGDVGTRNYVALISTVNCSATVCRAVAAHFQGGAILDEYPNVDGVIALTHGLGCAVDPRGDGYEILQRTIVGSALNPNVGAVIILGLGCETNQALALMKRYGLKETGKLRSFNIQDAGGTRASINRAIEHVRQMLPEINARPRVAASVSHLRVALQCGGSDAFSGLTANPALGVASDLLVALGGTAILSETPEIYGAEHLLASRAASPAVREKLLERIEWWRSYCAASGATMDNNPSFGNKVGGLTTIFEKSLGAVAKGGRSTLKAVYHYGEPVTERGLVFVDTPGYDPICATGQIASGANLMCFTTGRGSASGFKPVPTIKLATNSAMYQRMRDDMDINCGVIMEGESVEAVGRQIFRLMVDCASGKRTASEINGYGDNEFVPWQLGPIL